LAEKLDVEIKLVPDEEERTRCQNFGYFLLDNKQKDNGKIVMFPLENTAKPGIRRRSKTTNCRKKIFDDLLK